MNLEKNDVDLVIMTNKKKKQVFNFGICVHFY